MTATESSSQADAANSVTLLQIHCTASVPRGFVHYVHFACREPLRQLINVHFAATTLGLYGLVPTSSVTVLRRSVFGPRSLRERESERERERGEREREREREREIDCLID